MRAYSTARAPIAVYSVLLLLLFCLSNPAFAMTVKDLPALGGQPTARDINGDSIPLYKASYALLISNGTYKNGWPKLEQPGKELDALGLVLQKQGFMVRRVSDADSGQLNVALREFLFKVAKEPDSRVIVFFSGHGYTTKAGMGYLVPTDAPDPGMGENAFRELALPINELEVLAKETSSRHVLFILDSCFSGSIFTSKSFGRPDAATEKIALRQPYFLGAGQKPVRQFLAAGGAGERLPESSEFIPLLVAALTGTTTISQDGYLTGKELGLWIEQSLPHATGDRTHPHSDVIQDPKYVFGDMVFQVSGSISAPAPGQQQAGVSPPSQPSTSAPVQVPARAEIPKYHASIPETDNFALVGRYEVTYWREANDIRAEVVGSVGMRNGSKLSEYSICGLRLAIVKHTEEGWDYVAYSETKDFTRAVKRSDPGLPVGPLRFVIKVDPNFDPDNVWLVMIHYAPSKGFFGNQQCDQSYVPMHQAAKTGLFLTRDIVGVASPNADTCVKSETLTTETNDKSALPIATTLNVCYRPPRILVQPTAVQVKNVGKTVLLVEGLSLYIHPFKGNEWGKMIPSVRPLKMFNPPILVNPGQTVTLPSVEAGEFLITDQLRAGISPPSRVVIRVGLYDKHVNDDGLAVRSTYMSAMTSVLGKLANGTSGF